MGNGDLVNQVDSLLDQGKISQQVATTLILKLTKGVYEKIDIILDIQDKHEKRIANLERTDDALKKQFPERKWFIDRVLPGLLGNAITAIVTVLIAIAILNAGSL